MMNSAIKRTVPIVPVLTLIALLCAIPALTRAQQGEPGDESSLGAPSTQPASGDPVRPPDPLRFEGRGGRGEEWRRSPLELDEEPSSEEWEDVANFTQKHSPKRWEMFMDLPEEKRDRVRRFMYWRFRQVKNLEDADPQMYDLQVKRLAAEDDIFSLAWVIRRSDGEETDEVQQARQKLRGHVETLVEIGLNERQARIERMKRRVSGEEEQLSIDRGRQAQLVEERVDEILRPRSGPWMGGGDGPRRPFVAGPEGRAGEPIGGPRPEGAP